MIIDTLDHLLGGGVTLGDKVERGLRFLKETDFANQAAGKHEVDGETFYFVNEYVTKDASECFWEAHEVNLDLHYILEGTEKIGYAPIGRLQVKEAYNPDKDAVFFDGTLETAVTVSPGDVVICYPQDGHMTGIQVQEPQAVRKIVLKIKI